MASAPTRGARRAVVAAAFAACALACGGCDIIIGLETPVPEQDAGSFAAASAAPDAASQDASGEERDASMGEGISDAGVTEASPGIAACGDGSMACPNGCADILTASENCGACGHDCLGAPCSGGRCLPTVLAAGTPSHIAVDGTNVYWTDATLRTVMVCPGSGCPDAGPKTLYAWADSGSPAPFLGPAPYGATGAIAVQGSQVFFSVGLPPLQTYGDDDDILSCPTDGGASFVIAGGYSVGAVVTNAQSVYWMSPENGSENWGVSECPLSGCGTGTPIDVAFGGADPSEPWALAAGTDGVYYADVADGVGWCSASGCGCATDEPGSCEIANSNLEAAAIVVGNGSVFWASLNEVLVSTADSAASSPNVGVLVTAGASSTIGTLAVDNDNVYFTTGDDGGSIYSCAVTGCGIDPTLVASNLTGVGDIKVDAHRIYAVVGTEVGASVPGALGVVWIAK
jgi:hypothetical protein